MKDKIILWLISKLDKKPEIEYWDNLSTDQRIYTFKVPLYHVCRSDKWVDIKYHLEKAMFLLGEK